MNTLTVFTITLVLLWSCSADDDMLAEEYITEESEPITEESEPITEESEPITEESEPEELLEEESITEESSTETTDSSLTFYSCVACGGQEIISAYKKCRELKTENTKNITEVCVAKHLPPEATEGDNRWEHYCQNPESIFNVYECFIDYYPTLTDEDKVSIQQFKKCADEVNVEFCKGVKA